MKGKVMCMVRFFFVKNLGRNIEEADLRKKFAEEALPASWGFAVEIRQSHFVHLCDPHKVNWKHKGKTVPLIAFGQRARKRNFRKAYALV